VFAACIAACSPPAVPPPQPPARNPAELVVGFPEANVGGADLGPNQFTSMLSQEGLMSGTSVDGRPIPRLAESATWEEDGMRLRVKLRPGVVFHDGTPMTATVVAGILRTVMERPNSHASYSSLADVTAVKPIDDLQLVLELARKSAFLVEDLIMPLALRPGVGAGPFRVVRRDQSGVLFERFDRYYQGLPAIERIQVKTFDALRTAWSSLLRGEVDMVTDVPAEAVQFVANDTVDVIPYKRWYQFMVAFNSGRGPLASPAVRRALNLAIDRQALIQRALRGAGSPATGPLWPRHWAYDSTVGPFIHDPRAAVALLDGAGFREGAAAARSNLPKARLSFTCLLIEDFSLHERIGLELQKQLYDIGVDVRFEAVPASLFDTRVRDGQFEAVLIDMISGPSFGRPYLFWRSKKAFDNKYGFNQFGYENAEAERQFEVLRDSSQDEPATRIATNRLQRVFMDDPPALFLAWSERARVVGRTFTPIIEPDRDPVLTMWRWTPRTVEAPVGE
jgi:peptide/nickel transport system substrate-binding protein